MHEITSAVLKELQLYGIKPQFVSTHHGQKLTWQLNGRVMRQLPVPNGGHKCDPRAPLNARAQVRRWLREDGAKKAEPYVEPTTAMGKAFTPPTEEDLLPLYARLRKAEADLATLTDLVLDHIVHPCAVEVTVNGLPILGRRASLPRLVGPPAEPKEKKPRPDSIATRIVRALDYVKPTTPTEMAKELNAEFNTVATQLSSLFQKGKIARIGRGQYRKLPQP
jgi:hypothetical protein